MKIFSQITIFVLLISFSQTIFGRESNKSEDKLLQTTIGGQLNFLKDADSVKIVLREFDTSIKDTDSSYTVYVKKQKFLLELNWITRPLTMTISLPNERIPDREPAKYFQRIRFTILPGTKVFLSYRDQDFVFFGADAHIFNCQYSIFKMKENLLAEGPKFDIGHLNELKQMYVFEDSINNLLIKSLTNWKGEISRRAYDIIRLDLLYGWEASKYYLLNIQPRKARTIDYVFTSYDKMESGDTTLYSSLRNYPSYIVNKFKFDFCTSKGKQFRIGDCYDFIDKSLSGDLKERCLTYLITNNLKSDSLTKYRDIALSTLTNTSYKIFIDKLTSKYVEGILAADFNLSDMNGKQYVLSDFKGKVLVLDFWFTGCSPCKQTVPYLDSISKVFQNEPVVFISVNVDKSREVWMKSVLDGEYTFSNSIKVSTNGQDHPIIKNYGVRGYPTLILIDQAGKIMRRAMDPRLDNGDDMIKLINEKI